MIIVVRKFEVSLRARLVTFMFYVFESEMNGKDVLKTFVSEKPLSSISFFGGKKNLFPSKVVFNFTNYLLGFVCQNFLDSLNLYSPVFCFNSSYIIFLSPHVFTFTVLHHQYHIMLKFYFYSVNNVLLFLLFSSFR